MIETKQLLKNSVIGGQITGCNINNALKIKNKVNSFLYIGSGIFHPIEIAIKTKKKVYIATAAAIALAVDLARIPIYFRSGSELLPG